jgi:molybdopterin/thiamine biosynthesis adenylyltransferase
LKVGIIGLGGGGSLLNEWLSRLGVGHIVAVDFDKVDVTNLPRIVGASRWDAHAWLRSRGNSWVQKIGARWASYKVHVARRVAKRANPSIRFDAIIGDVLDQKVALLLKDVDFVFLASDTIQSRLVFNALVQQYLIPGAQVGAKVLTEKATGLVGDITVATRPVLPFSKGGCLECHGLIPASLLNEESLSNEQRKRQKYVDDDLVFEPSVITLNALSASEAVNDFMMMFTGLYDDGVTLNHELHFVRERKAFGVDATANDACPDCSSNHRSRRARGDRYPLPCRNAE